MSDSDREVVVNVQRDSINHHRGLGFYMIFTALAFTSLLSALDSSIISTALPTIVNDLNTGELYVWAINCYFLSATTVQPLYAQCANVFGRRSLIMIAISAFALGSGLSAGASSTAMLIAGRAIQGLGGGGINMLSHMIVSDLVPQRERAKFMGLIFAVFGVGTTIGPVLGGAIVQNTSWRWIFWINLPICGVSLALVVLFLNLRYDRETSIIWKLRRIDYSGNALLMVTVVAVLLALTWGGTKYRWSSFRIVVPLVLGLVGMAGFLFYQGSSLVKEPTMPLRLFMNRTSLSTYILTFFHSIMMFWMTYFIPLYFQSVKGSSTATSGINLLPFCVFAVVAAILSGQFISTTGRYTPVLFAGFGFIALGFGLFSTLDEKTSKPIWIVYTIFAGIGVGVLLTSILPAVQAPLPESDVGSATGTWGFLRSFGGVWGVSIPSAIFNSRVNSLSTDISNIATAQKLRNGGAYQLAGGTFLRSLNHDPGLKSEVLAVYINALKLVWRVGIGFALFSFIVVFFVEQIALKDHLNTEFGLDEKRKPETSARSVIALGEQEL